MGYTTKFDFRKLEGSQEDWCRFCECIEEIADERFCGHEGSNPEPMEEFLKYDNNPEFACIKWYDSDIQISKISKEYPDLIVLVHEIGEEGEECYTRFKGGDSETHVTEIPDFTEILTKDEMPVRSVSSYREALDALKKQVISDIVAIVKSKNGYADFTESENAPVVKCYGFYDENFSIDTLHLSKKGFFVECTGSDDEMVADSSELTIDELCDLLDFIVEKPNDIIWKKS